MSTATEPAGAPGTRRVRAVALAMTAAAVVLGALAGHLVAVGAGAAVLALALVAIPAALWRWPHLAPAFLLSCALMVEQFELAAVQQRQGLAVDVRFSLI